MQLITLAADNAVSTYNSAGASHEIMVEGSSQNRVVVERLLPGGNYAYVGSVAGSTADIVSETVASTYRLTLKSYGEPVLVPVKVHVAA